MKFTQGNPALIAAAQAACLSFVGLAGRGATAPGAVVIREGNSLHPFAVHFFNSQDGGYYFGDYCKTREEADRAAADKLSRYDRDGELRKHFDYDPGVDTRLPRFCATRLNTTNEPIIIKRGESGYWPGSRMNVATDEDIAAFNERCGATPGMIEAMEFGSMFGWDKPGATLEAGEEIAQRAAAVAANA